jgi:hypothetical protein
MKWLVGIDTTLRLVLLTDVRSARALSTSRNGKISGHYTKIAQQFEPCHAADMIDISINR